MEGETTLLELRPSRWAYLPSYLAGLFLCVIFFVINGLVQTGLPWIGWAGPPLGVLFILVTDIVRAAEAFLVSDDGVTRQFTLFSTQKTFIEFEDVEQVNARQTIFQRIFGIGDVEISSAAEDPVGIVFHDIADPSAVEDAVRKKMDEANAAGKPAHP